MPGALGALKLKRVLEWFSNWPQILDMCLGLDPEDLRTPTLLLCK